MQKAIMCCMISKKCTDIYIIIKQKQSGNGAYGIAIGAGGGMGGHNAYKKTNLKASLDTKISELPYSKKVWRI